MNFELTAAIIGVLLLGFFMAFFLLYHQYMVKRQTLQAVQQRGVAIEKTLDRFFEDSSKSATKEKLATIDKIKLEMEAKIQQKSVERQTKAKVQLDQMAKKGDEGEIIEEGGRVLLSFSEGLKSAEPITEAERAQDMQDLMAAVKALEGLDQTHYRVQEDRSVDMGKGMLYDSISTKLQKIIRTKEYGKMPFLQAEKLELEAFDAIKRLEHNDFMETLHVMKEIGSIKDLIEINPQTNLIVFSKDPLKLTQAEKVVLSFASDQDILTLDRLQEKTEWKPAYVNQVIKGFEKKPFFHIRDNNIVVDGLITADERKARQEKFEEIKQSHVERQKRDEELVQERIKQQEAKKAEQQKQQQEMLQKQKAKLMEEARIKVEQDTKIRKEEAEKVAEQDEIERLEKIRAMPKPKIKALPGLASPTTGGVPVVPISPQSLPSGDAKMPDRMAQQMAAEAKILAESLSKSSQPASQVDPTTGQPGAPAAQPAIQAKVLPKPSVAKMDFSKIEADADTDSIPELDMPEGDEFGEMPDLGVPSEDGFGGEDDLEGLKAMINKMENKEKSMAAGKKSKKPSSVETPEPTPSGDLADYFSVGDDETIPDEVSANQPVIDEIVNIFNDLAPKTAGIITFEALLKFLNQSSFPELKKIDLLQIIDEMKEQQIVLDEISLAGTDIYFFEDHPLDDDMKTLLRQFIINGKVDLEDLATATDWNSAQVKRVVKRFQDQKLVQQDKDKKYFMPGLFNN